MTRFSRFTFAVLGVFLFGGSVWIACGDSPSGPGVAPPPAAEGSRSGPSTGEPGSDIAADPDPVETIMENVEAKIKADIEARLARGADVSEAGVEALRKRIRAQLEETHRRLESGEATASEIVNEEVLAMLRMGVENGYLTQEEADRRMMQLTGEEERRRQ